MRHAQLVVMALLALVAACSKEPAAAPEEKASGQAAADATPPPVASSPAMAGPAVSGTFTGDGKPATITQVSAYPDEPFDDQPVTAIVFTAKEQVGDAKKVLFSATFGDYGEAIVAKVTPDGNLIGVDILHPGVQPNGSVSLSGVLTMENYKNSGGEISGRLTSNGDEDVFGHTLNLDLTFHTKAP